MSARPQSDPSHHSLPNPWVFWVITLGDRNYEIEPIVSFETIEEFWDYYLQLPPLSKLRRGGIALFKNGITPAWEDRCNRGGNTFRLMDFTQPHSAKWESLLISAISGEIETQIPRSNFCGIYTVLKPDGQWGVDLWFGRFESATRERGVALSLGAIFGRVKPVPRR
jgi:hypothetical protein